MNPKQFSGPIAFLTCRGKDEAKDDDRCQMALFQERGIPVEHVIWNEFGQDWSRFKAVIIRSTWDYQLKGNLEPFLNVLQEIESAGVLLLNPLRTIEWNCRKTYLKSLDPASCMDSLWLKRADLPDLIIRMKEKNWSDCVIKPIVSAYGAHTYRVSKDNEAEILATCILSGISEWILQPFFPEIMDEGEWSFILLKGKCIHTVLKKPGLGQFLTFGTGGNHEAKTPPQWMIQKAEKIAADCGYKTIVARVDLIRQKDQAKVMELEAIDPYLYFHGSRELNEVFVQSIIEECQNRICDSDLQRAR